MLHKNNIKAEMLAIIVIVVHTILTSGKKYRQEWLQQQWKRKLAFEFYGLHALFM